jgi:putative hydrolase of the HAD superfamily
MHLEYSGNSIDIEMIDLKEVKGILIDFDNTLYEYAPCHEKALYATYEKVHEMVSTISFNDFLILYVQAQRLIKERLGDVASSHSRILYFQAMLESVFKKTMIEESVILEECYWETFYQNISYNENILGFLERARNNTIKICLVTDLTATIQFRKMVASGMCSYVDFVITSEEVGREKPDKAMFSLALSKLGLSASEVIMIGDDRTKDIQGAEACAIKAYHVVY